MKNKLFGRIRHIHLVGIGGAGMSAIAEVLLNNGLKVSGSDASASEATDRLKERGAIVFIGHQSEQIAGAEVVAHSSAVKPDENPETVEAKKQGIPVIKRDELLGELMRHKAGICIAGTHGKTTTTTMIATMLNANHLEPTALIGGVSDYFLGMNGGGSSLVGEGDFMVIEADEYDRTFLKLTPQIAVMTTLEAEHLDIYSGLDDLKQAFTEFANKAPFYGAVVLCHDEENLRALVPNIKRKVISYGMNAGADLQASDVFQSEYNTRFKVSRKGSGRKEESLGEIELQAVGIHNVKNALAAIAVGLEIGLTFEDIQHGLSKFRSVRRRFQIRFSATEAEPILVDDYAHHPTEIRVTLEAAKKGWGNRKLVAVLQPHLFSRTKEFASEFASALSLADEVIVTEVYPSREQAEDFSGVTSELIASKVTKPVSIIPKSNLKKTVLGNLKGNEMVVMMGAGDISKIAEETASALKEKYSK